MTAHRTANDKVRELASLFAAGALPPDEEARFAEHLESCAVCAAEARTFRETANWLPFDAQGPPAPAHLRDRLLDRIRQPQPPPGIQVIRAKEGSWHPLVPGVAAKRLYADAKTGNVALLVRMEAGAKYPPHSHADVEHCYVIEGDLRFGDLVLQPGDYQCALPSTDHRDSHTLNGCVVLIIASQNNAMLPWTL